MPYKVFKDGERHCVYKVDENGDKTGKSLGCHENESDAMDQVKAVYANESKKSSSITRMINMIHSAWDEAYDWSGYVVEVFNDYVVVHLRKKWWKVPYTIDGDSVKFSPENEWSSVELTSEWVSKSIGGAIKSIGKDRVGGFAVLYGDEKRKDLDQNWFTKSTEEYLEIFNGVGCLPWLFDHGVDKAIKTSVIGIVDTMEEVPEVGIWYEAKVREFNLYKQYVKPLLDAGMLFTSTGTLPAAAKALKSGEIVRWPIAEVTGTHTPAEYRMLGRPIEEIKSAYKSAGIDASQIFNDESLEDENDDQGGAVEAQALIDIKKRQLELLSII